jgi:excisionase family DNA binding protein
VSEVEKLREALAVLNSFIAKYDQVWTVEEAATFLRLRVNTVYELIQSGKIPSLRFGKSIRLRKLDVLGFDASVSVGAAEKK